MQDVKKKQATMNMIIFFMLKCLWLLIFHELGYVFFQSPRLNLIPFQDFLISWMHLEVPNHIRIEYKYKQRIEKNGQENQIQNVFHVFFCFNKYTTHNVIPRILFVNVFTTARS